MFYLKSIGNSFTSFFKDDCFYHAASIAYCLIVALVPLSLLVISLFGYMLGGNEELYNFLLNKLADFFPSVTSGITNELTNLITYKGISLISFIIYVFFALELFYSVEHAMDIIFKVPKKRHFLLSFFWTITILTLFIFFWVFSFTMTTLSGFFSDHNINMFGIGLGYNAGIFINYVAPFIFVLLTFTAVYKIVPHIKVHTRHAFAGALLVTVLLEIAKNLFTLFVKNISYIGTIYGSLSTFILFLLWMYYLSSIFLLGGQFVKSLGGRHAGTDWEES